MRRSASSSAGGRAHSPQRNAANLRNAATEIAQADAIHTPLLKVLADADGSWTGTMGELLTALNASLAWDGHAAELRKSREWPRTAKALGNKLTRLAPALEQEGVVVGEAVRSHGRTTRTITQADVHPQRAPEQPPGSAE